MNPNHPGWQRLADAVWDEDAHQRYQAEQIAQVDLEQWDREMRA